MILLVLFCMTSSVFTLDLSRFDRQPKITYPGICDSTNCRYGTCEVYNLTQVICHCLAGVTGDECDKLDTSKDPCSSNPCYSGSTCISSGGTYFCACTPGFSGSQCSSHVGPCKCQNGGTCSLVAANTYSCNCPSAYAGTLCQYQLSSINQFCIKEPCLNNGTCIVVSTTNGYCSCANNFKGTYCEIYSPSITTTGSSTTATAAPTITRCPSTATLCQNGGTCYIRNGSSVFCECPVGFTGTYCETSTATSSTTTTTTNSITTSSTAVSPAIVPCSSSITICQNGGSCFIVNGASVLCACKPGFSGSLCEMSASTTLTSTTSTTSTTKASTTIAPIIPCGSGINVCQNAGTCYIINGANIVCTNCANGFTGNFCEIPPTTTTTSTTTSTTTTTTPTTTTTTTTTLSSTTVAPIAPCGSGFSICQNGGSCFILNGATVLCSCTAGYSGNFCEAPLITTTTLSTTTTISTTTTSPSTTTTTTVAPIATCPTALTICQNGASCFILNGASVLCSCTSGFTGDFCETPLVTTTTTTTPSTLPSTAISTTTAASIATCPAVFTICQNGASCFILNGATILCSCPNGFTGEFCETSLVTTTTSTTISSTLTTTTTLSTTTATTSTSTSAATVPCETSLNVCQNGGSCYVVNGSSLMCVCQTGYTGTFCEYFS